MSQHDEVQELKKHVEAGRLLSKRLRQAREMNGPVVCPVCHVYFDATHVMKCPECRTFIDDTFQAASPRGKGKNQQQTEVRQRKILHRKPRASRKAREKMELELDFFTQGYMEYKG